MHSAQCSVATICINLTDETVSLINRILLFSAVGFSGPPRIVSPEEELIVKSGAAFTLVCEANAPIEWHLPDFIKVSFLIWN